MPISELRLVKRCAEYLSKEEIKRIPAYTRGVYVLFKYRPRVKKYDVVYVGLAAGEKAGSIRGRLRTHRNSVRKKDLWTHFSAFEVWDNIQENEIAELEGLFRHIYRKDTRANRLNRQKGFGKLRKIVKSTKKEGWLVKKKAKAGK